MHSIVLSDYKDTNSIRPGPHPYDFTISVTSLDTPSPHSAVVVQSLNHVQLFCDSTDCSLTWTVARMGFLRQEYCSGLPVPSPGDLSDPGIKPVSHSFAGIFFATEPPGKPMVNIILEVRASKYEFGGDTQSIILPLAETLRCQRAKDPRKCCEMQKQGRGRIDLRMLTCKIVIRIILI